MFWYIRAKKDNILCFLLRIKWAMTALTVHRADSQTKTNSMHYHAQIILSTNYWFNVARVQSTDLHPIQYLEGVHEYFVTIISALNMFYICFGLNTDRKTCIRCCSEGGIEDMRIWIVSDAFRWEKNSSSVVWINIPALASIWQHHCSARGILKKWKCMQSAFSSRASSNKISKEISRLHNTCLTGSLYLFSQLSSKVNDIRYCTAPGANL